MEQIIEFNNEKYLVKRVFRNLSEQDISHFKESNDLNEVLQKDGLFYCCERIRDAIFEDIIEEQIKKEQKNEEILQQTCEGQNPENNE